MGEVFRGDYHSENIFYSSPVCVEMFMSYQSDEKLQVDLFEISLTECIWCSECSESW